LARADALGLITCTSSTAALIIARKLIAPGPSIARLAHALGFVHARPVAVAEVAARTFRAVLQGAVFVLETSIAFAAHLFVVHLDAPPMVRALVRAVRDLARHTGESELAIARAVDAGTVRGAVAWTRLLGAAWSAPAFAAVTLEVHRAQATPVAVLRARSLLAALACVPGVALTNTGITPAVVRAFIFARLACAAAPRKSWVTETLASLADSASRASLGTALGRILDVAFRTRHVRAPGPRKASIACAVAVHCGVVHLLLLALAVVRTGLVRGVGRADRHIARLAGPAGRAFALTVAAAVPAMVAGVFAGVDGAPGAGVGPVALTLAIGLTRAVVVAPALARFLGATRAHPRLALKQGALRHSRTDAGLVGAGAVSTAVVGAEGLGAVVSSPPAVTLASSGVAVLALVADSVKAAARRTGGDRAVKAGPGLLARARTIVAALAMLGAVAGARLRRAVVARPHLPFKRSSLRIDGVARALACGRVA
jgi:hypothetical protein